MSENGVPLLTQTGTQANQYWIRWQHDLQALESHTFVLKYRVIGGVQTQNDDTSAINWKALFPERSAPIQQGKVTVHLPDQLADQVTRFSSAGIPATQRQLAPTLFEFVAAQSLAPKEFLAVNVQFPQNILNLSTPEWQRTSRLLSAEQIVAGFIWVMMGGLCFVSLLRGKSCPSGGSFDGYPTGGCDGFSGGGGGG